MALLLLPCAARPFLLGFYLDDWSVLVPLANVAAPFGLQRLEAAFQADLTRPAEAPIRFLLSSLLGADPFFGQLGMLLLNVAVAASTGWLAGAWAGAASRRQWQTAVTASAVWFLWPWSLSARGWPILAPMLVFLILLAWMGVLLLSWLEARTQRWWPFAAIQACLALGYESTYLQFLAFGFGAMTLIRSGRTTAPRVWKAMALLAAAQATGFAYRLFLATTGRTRRALYPEWAGQLWKNLAGMGREMASATGELWLVLAAAVLLAACVLAAAVVREGWRRCLRIGGWTAFACLFGGLASVAVYSAGGRTLTGLGIESRSFTVLSF